jgi:DNA repair exonuclease SbcCD ATPase subunit
MSRRSPGTAGVRSLPPTLAESNGAAASPPVGAPDVLAQQMDALRAAVQYRDELLGVFQAAASERLVEIERRGAIIAELERRLDAAVLLSPDVARLEVLERELERIREELADAVARIAELEPALEEALEDRRVAVEDAIESRKQYEVVAREVIVLRNETLRGHLARIWGRSILSRGSGIDRTDG